MDDLRRFLDAQAPIYTRVLQELAAGEKRSHWMWFVFPQLRGLGSSAMAQRYGLAGRAEGEAYVRHSILCPRLVECTRLVLAVRGKTALDIFGYPDDLKFPSSMTLFASVAADPEPFRGALDKYFAGVSDPRTLALL